MSRNRLALRKHPSMSSRPKLALGLALQEIFWQVSRLVDSGRFTPGMIDVHRFDLGLPGLPPPFAGYRIVHISDIHMGTWMNTGRLAGIMQMVNEQQPDLVAITGDFVSYTVEGVLGEMDAPLASLRAPDGVFAVLGNHDMWTDPDAVRAMLDRAGVLDLRNAHVTLARGESKLHIAGVDDVYDGEADLDRVLAGLPEDGPAILLAHEPDFADAAAESGRFALQLSGHSHGGQLVFPFVGPLYLPHLAKKYPRGRYDVRGMQLYTNRGLGTTALQMRLRCPPEIAVITLKR